VHLRKVGIVNILPIDSSFLYLAQGKSIDEISKIMVKTLDVIRQKVFDLNLKVKIVKEKKQSVFPHNQSFFSSKNRYRNNEWLTR
jgi:hypothetical protein